VVLGALGILALVAVSFAQVARNHMRLAAAVSEGAKAEALADAGVHMAILDLIAARENQQARRRFALDGAPLTCSVGDGTTLTIVVQDEAGKVDLNIASTELLRTLVLGAGLRAGEAAADAILDYRDEDNDRRISGAEHPEYLAAGKAYGPRNGALLAVEELARVLGIVQADTDLLRPFVTIYSGLAAIDVNVAPRALIDVLGRGLRQGGGPSLLEGSFGASGLSAMEDRSGLPARFLAASTRRAFFVRSQARTAMGVTFVREAVVEFVAPNAGAFLLRRWHRGSAATGNSPQANLTAC
jgi:general secretion pathway protein K